MWEGSISALCLEESPDPLLALCEKSHLPGFCLRVTRNPSPTAGGFVSHEGNPNSPWLFLSHGHPQLDDLGYLSQETFISPLVFLHGNESHFIPIQSTSMCSRHPSPKSTQIHPLSFSALLVGWGYGMLWDSKTMKYGPEPQKNNHPAYIILAFLKLTILNIGWQSLVWAELKLFPGDSHWYFHCLAPWCKPNLSCGKVLAEINMFADCTPTLGGAMFLHFPFIHLWRLKSSFAAGYIPKMVNPLPFPLALFHFGDSVHICTGPCSETPKL